MKRLLLVVLATCFLQPALAEEKIPRSMAEKAEYFLVSVEKDGDYLRTVHQVNPFTLK